MVGAPAPRRGDIWWAAADKKRPVLVVQAKFLNRSRAHWILAVPLTTKLERAGVPGNVRLSKRDTGLPKQCVANVSQVAPLHRSGFRERVGRAERAKVDLVDEGLRLVLGL